MQMILGIIAAKASTYSPYSFRNGEICTRRSVLGTSLSTIVCLFLFLFLPFFFLSISLVQSFFLSSFIRHTMP